MENVNTPSSRAGEDATAIVTVLLVLQTGFGLLSVLGLLIFAALTGSLARAGGAALFALAMPLLALAFAAGLIAGRRWASMGAFIFEGLVLLGAVLRLLISGGNSAALVPLMTTVALPICVVVLLVRQRRRERGYVGRSADTTDAEYASPPEALPSDIGA